LKISGVNLTAFSRPFAETGQLKIKYIEPSHLECLAIEITADEGASGEAMCAFGARAIGASIATHVRPLLVGRDPARREEIWHEIAHYNRL